MTSAGFQIVDRVVSTDRCSALASALGAPGRGAGTRHLMSHPEVAALARGAALVHIARQWVGASAVPYRATLFAKSGRANWLVAWHQDTALPLEAAPATRGWGPSSVKQGVVYAKAPTWALARIVALRLHLDASGGYNGPLRVVRGSHHGGVLSPDGIASTVLQGAPFECHVARGGVLAMSPLLVHASSKARTDAPRRVLHIEYASDLQLAPDVRLAIA